MKKTFFLIVLNLFIVGFIFGQQSVDFKTNQHSINSPVVHPTKVSTAIYHDVLPSLKDLPPVDASYYLQNTNKLAWDRQEDIKDADYSNWEPMGPDPAWQNFMGGVQQPKGLSKNFTGQSSPYLPSDCNGTVGPNHFFQTVNSTYAVYDKNGTQVIAPTAMNTLFTGVAGASYNDGDPLILWDEDAGRWLAVEFSHSGTPDYMLFAISQTSDPTGSWDRWSFVMNGMPDYEKVGINSDGYFMGTNTYTGDDVYVFERDEMIAGSASPQMIQFENPNRPNPTSFNVIVPLDGDGAFNSDNARFMAINDDAWGYEVNSNKDEIWIFDCVVDWNTPSNSTFGRSQVIVVSDFDTKFNAWGVGDLPQTGGSQLLDANPYVLMTRVQFKNIGGEQLAVCTHTVDVDNTNHAGLRWYQLRYNSTSSAWEIKQEGTYAPDALSRWMGSIAMNDVGQIALGYSVTSATMSPQIRYTGQTSCAPTGVMDIAEQTVATTYTSGYQSSYTRWGDYFLTTVDPTDNTTFWCSIEYYSSGKKTQIFSFTLDEACAAPTVSGVSPSSLYEDRGKQLTVTGSDMVGCSFTIGGVSGTVVSNDGSTAVVTFPAGNYTNGTLTVANGAGSDNSQSITINTRNTIPVVAGSTVTSDNHPTIQSAVDGLHAWYGTTAFNVGDLAGTKTVDVYAGTYTDEVVLNSGLNPTAANPLIIQNHSGETVIVDATENSYGFNLSTVDYVQLKGFTVHSADIDNIYAQGDNVTISYNKTYGSVGGSGIKVETGTPFTITNNLAYSNFKYGIEVLSANNIIKNNTADDNGGSSNPATGVLIWSEDWESGSYTGWLAGSGWSVYIDALSHSPTHSVELLNATNTSITYSSVDVTNYDNLTVSAWARSDASNMNGQDYLYGEYSFDNSTWIQIFYIENDHTTFINYSATGITKTSNTLYIRFRGACDALEYWMVDDVLVTGDETGSPFQSGAGLYVANVSATVENNIFVAKTGSDDYYALISPGNAVVSDYNTYYTTNTNLFDYNGTVGNAGPMSVNDITADPLFVNAGTDFHIKSTSGSYNGGEWPPLTASSGTWTNDPTDDSPAIDAGNGDAFGNEPAPNGGTINQGAYGNTLQASKSAAVVVPISWNGSVSSDWQTLNNWTPNTAIPTATDNVLIPNGMPNYPVIDDGTTIALCDDIEIENSASVTIAPNGEMTVSGIITNAAGNTGLVIQSDASGTGSLIHNNTSGIDVTVQQLLAAGGRAWHMVGSPISDATVSVFPNTTYLYYYDETNDDYWTGSTYDAGSTLGWTNYNAGALTVGNGYLYNNFQTTLNFVGLLNTKTAGDNLTLSYTDQGGTAPNGSSYNNYDGWNFVSNPYTSAIDWDLVNSAGANLYDAIYVWDDIAGTYKTYVDGTNSWDGAATNGGSKYIPAMQGFFVKFNEALGTSGTLTLPSSARVHNTQSFWKGDVTDQTPDNFMRIVVANDNFHDEAVVRFLNNATERMDNRLDAYKLFSHYNYVPQLYTLGNDNTEYSINSLPELSADKTTVVPLRVYCTSQDFSIFLSEFNFAYTRVYLRDNFSDNGNVQVYELSPNSRLNFNSNPNNEVDRFELIFVPIQNSTVFDVVDIQDYNLSVYPNPSSGSFYLRVDDYKGDYEVRISTITGQSVYKNTFTGKEYQNVLVENASTGIYLLTVILDNGIVKYERIIIK